VVIGDAAAPSGFHHLETSSRNFTLAPGGHLTVTVALPRRGPLARAAARHRSIGIAIWRLRVTDDPRTPLRDVDETHPDQELKART
jgi:hypothetical protein